MATLRRRIHNHPFFRKRVAVRGGPMRTKSLIGLFTFAVLVALTGAIAFHYTSRGIFAQASAAAAGQRGRGGAVNAQVPPGGRGRGAPVIQGPPAGVAPLPLDLFSSKNFYKDKALWMD